MNDRRELLPQECFSVSVSRPGPAANPAAELFRGSAEVEVRGSVRLRDCKNTAIHTTFRSVRTCTHLITLRTTMEFISLCVLPNPLAEASSPALPHTLTLGTLQIVTPCKQPRYKHPGCAKQARLSTVQPWPKGGRASAAKQPRLCISGAHVWR